MGTTKIPVDDSDEQKLPTTNISDVGEVIVNRILKRVRLRTALVLGPLPLLTACGDPGETGETRETSEGSASQAVTDPLIQKNLPPLPALSKGNVELAYEFVEVRDADQQTIGVQEQGALTDEVRERVARPYQFFGEDYLYGFTAWQQTDSEGNTVKGYRAFRKPNENPEVVRPTQGAPTLDPGAKRALELDDSEGIEIDIALRNFPDWNIPLHPHWDVPLDTMAAKLDQRKQALAERKALFHSMATGVINTIEALGGTITATGANSGSIIARVSVGILRKLSRRSDLLSIASLSDLKFQSGGTWRQGQGKWTTRTYGNAYDAAGYDGEHDNPGRHDYGAITIGIIEDRVFEDEACFLYDTAACQGTSRLQERFLCNDADNDFNYCESVSSFADVDTDDHGTYVAAIALGDYSNGQADGRALGDNSFSCTNPTSCTCTSGSQCSSGICSSSGLCAHSDSWESYATGMAPEARLIYFGGVSTASEDETTASFTDAFDDAVDRSVDITSNSWGWMPEDAADVCHPTANLSFEREAENAFDDGILNVACAGNAGISGSCNTWAPGSIPKVIAVNGLDGAQSDVCPSDYRGSCLAHTGSSSEGGADVTADGSLRTRAATVVDMVAPSNINFFTSADGTLGTVDDDGGVIAGCSMATPHVAGLAAAVKDMYLSHGDTWINDPGVLHTTMLGMTDRHFGTLAPTGQRVTGGDKVYGFGRIRLRLFDGELGASGYSHSTHTFAAGPTNPTVTTQLWPGPMQSGTEVLKCVLFQYEDTSSDANPPTISNLNLKLVARATVGGACSATGTVARERSDNSYDWKSMVAIEAVDALGGLGGRCAYAEIDPSLVSGGVSAHLFCYYSATQDDAPN